MLVRNRMTPNPDTVTPEDMLVIAQEKMARGKFRHLPVVQDGSVVGMLTDRDIQPYVGLEDRTRVNMAMVAHPLTVTLSITVEDAAKRMLAEQVRGLPVVEGKKLVGIITSNDIMQAFLDGLGASATDSFRVDMADEEKGPALVTAPKLIEEIGGEVLSIGTYRTPHEDQGVFYLRLRGIDPKTASAALRDKGYTVLSTHA